MDRKECFNELQQIPGVGNKLSQYFFDIGIKRIEDLRDKDPDELYFMMCAHQGHEIDRCVLYICRLSVYFAKNEIHDLKKLKWWNWKDKK